MQAVCAKYDQLPFADETFSLVIAEWAPTVFGLRGITGYVATSHSGRRGPPRHYVSWSDKQGCASGSKGPPGEPYGGAHVRPSPNTRLWSLSPVMRSFIKRPSAHALWERFYADATRRAWSLFGRDETNANGSVKALLEEAHWYRNVGRGRVFCRACYSSALGSYAAPNERMTPSVLLSSNSLTDHYYDATDYGLRWCKHKCTGADS